MRAFLLGVSSIAIVGAYVVATLAAIAWFTLLPSIGFLWLIGWLR